MPSYRTAIPPCTHVRHRDSKWCLACEHARRKGTPEQYDELFWTHVDKSGECWIWTGARDHAGYGVFRSRRAPRYSYERFVGPLAANQHVDHFVCSNPPCVRPSHLKATTPRENVLRSEIGLSAVNARKTHCKRGHEFTPENTRRNGKDGRGRMCRICVAELNRGYKAAKKAAR